MHRHACGRGHYWDCDGTAIRYSETEPTVCMCLDHGVPLEEGEHSRCGIELLDCPRHRTGQADSTESHLPTEDQVEEGWQPIQMPDNVEEMIQNWNNDREPNIGWCLLCNSAIRREDDLILGTNTHDCAVGRALEAKCRESSAKAGHSTSLTSHEPSAEPEGPASDA